MEKLLPMEGIYQILEKWLPLAKKSVSNNQNEGFVSKLRQNYVSTRQAKTITGINAWKIDKEMFPLVRKSLSTNRNAFKDMFAL